MKKRLASIMDSPSGSYVKRYVVVTCPLGVLEGYMLEDGVELVMDVRRAWTHESKAADVFFEKSGMDRMLGGWIGCAEVVLSAWCAIALDASHPNNYEERDDGCQPTEN